MRHCEPAHHTPSAPEEAATLDRLLRARHSCRAFLPDPVPRPIIARILEMAQRTASWCNSQPWQVVVTSGAATERFRAAIYRHAANRADGASDFRRPREYRGVYLERRRESGYQLYNTLGIPRGDRAAYERQALENFRLFGAPHVAIITTDEALDVYGAVDCGGYVSTFMLAAQSFGVATIAQAALARYAPFVRAHFGLPANRRMVCGISFGYADRSHPVNGYRTSRADLSEVVTWAE
ncbi:MAG TPA: nitroreductase [Vicinamibacterales bacterium]|nr:nitroreductase [Vicinamibacterales bacterium]